MTRREIMFAAMAAMALSLRRIFLRDDTRHLQAIIDGQAASGIVRLPSGTFNVFSPLVFPPTVRHAYGCNARLRGFGDGAVMSFTGPAHVQDFFLEAHGNASCIGFQL